MMKSYGWWIVSLLLLSLVIGLMMRSVTRPMGLGDSERYLAIVQKPRTFTESPWGYRIAVPYAAAVLIRAGHISPPRAFEFIQFGLYAALLSTLVAWLRLGFRVAWPAALAATTLFVISYNGVYNLHNTSHVGYAEFLFLLLGMIAIYHRQFIFLCVVIFLSAFVKETIALILIPVFLAAGWGEEKPRTLLLRFVLLGTLYLFPFLLLRSGLIFRAGGDLKAYSSFYTWEYVRFVFDYYGGFGGAILRFLMTFGPVWIFAVAGFFTAPPRLKRMSIMVPLAAIQILLATDVYRMVGCAFPIIIVLACLEFEQMKPAWLLLPLTLLCAAYFFVFNATLNQPLGLVIFMPIGLAAFLLIRRLAVTEKARFSGHEAGQ